MGGTDIRIRRFRRAVRKDTPGVSSPTPSAPHNGRAANRPPALSLYGDTETAVSALGAPPERVRTSPIRRETNGSMTRLLPEASIFANYRRGEEFVRLYLNWRRRRRLIGAGEVGR